MVNEWKPSTWGEEVSLEYGKALRGYDEVSGAYRVFGSNGPIGWTDTPLVKGPGVILGRKGAYRGVEFCREPFFVIDTAYYVVPKAQHDMRWLYYAIKHHKLGEIDDGSPIPSTTRSAVYVKELDVPPPLEQRLIADVLGALDDKVDLNRMMARVLEGIALAIFTSWFVEFDPVRRAAAGQPTGLPLDLAMLFPKSLADSSIGEIPAGWDTIALYDTAQYINGAAFRTEHFCDRPTGLPVIKIAELKEGITCQTEYSNRSDLDAKYLIDTGELLYSWSGSPETSLDVFLWTKGRGLLNQHIFRVVTEGPARKRFVYYLLRHLRSDLVEIARNKQTTGLGHVTVADMKRVRVCHPPAPVQNAFDRLVGPLFDKCFGLAMESDALAALRDVLLPKLLSGELRIADAEKIVGRAV